MVSIKLFWNNELRRLSSNNELNYGSLISIAKQLFPALECYTELHFAWTDEEDDNVLLSSEQELHEAVRVMTEDMGGSAKFDIIPISNKDPETTGATAVKVSHLRVTCDECGVCPILGSRFKCAVREDFDLCESCELKKSQPHPMIKIYSPDQAPVAIFVSVNDEGKAFENQSVPGYNVPPHTEHHQPHHHRHQRGPPHHPHHPSSCHQPPPCHPHGPWRGGRGRWGHCHPQGRWGPKHGRGWRKFLDETLSTVSGYASVAVDLARSAEAHLPTVPTSTPQPQSEESFAESEMVKAAMELSLHSTGEEETKYSETVSEQSTVIPTMVMKEDHPEPMDITTPTEPVTESVIPSMQAAIPYTEEVTPSSAMTEWELVNTLQRDVANTTPTLVTDQSQDMQTQHEEEWTTELELLANMGFYDTKACVAALNKFSNPSVYQQRKEDKNVEPSMNGMQRVIDALLSDV